MSDGTVPALPFAEILIPWFAILYFAVGAVGVLIARKRDTLLVIALLAHSMLLTTFCLLCTEDSDANAGKFIADILRIAFIMVVYFLPWLVLWGMILAKAERRVVRPQDQPFQKSDRPSEKYANEIKSKY